jgi:signal transduction histidine kinase
MGTHVFPDRNTLLQTLEIYPFVIQGIEKAKQRAIHRKIQLKAEGPEGVSILMEPKVHTEVIDGLVRNAIENTPDGGLVTVGLEEKDESVLLHVTDCGIGISEEDQAHIFDGLFHTKDTEMYASRRPYDFEAGGKGLDLFRMKVYTSRFGFGLSVKSTRCPHLPGEADQCSGDISHCPFCKAVGDCAGSGGTTFTVSFTRSREKPHLPVPPE